MTKVVFTRKARHRVFAAFMALLMVLCMTNFGAITVNAASDDIPKRTAPVLTSFDRNYLNYYNTINKKVAADSSIDTPREAVETYLKISNISYRRNGGDDWNFKLQFRDFTCSVKSGTSTKGSSISLIDKIGFEAVVVSRSGNQAKIKSNDGPANPYTKSLAVSSKDAKAKAFTMRSGSYVVQSTDIAMIITTIGGFYGSKTSVTGYKSGVQNHAEFVTYLADYLESHSKDAETVRNYLVSTAKANNGTIKSSAIVHLYPSGQQSDCHFSYATSYSYPDEVELNSNASRPWQVSSFMSIFPYTLDIGHLAVYTNLWPTDGSENDIVVIIRDGTNIEFYYGDESSSSDELKLNRTISWNRPKTTLTLDVEYRDDIDPSWPRDVIRHTNTNALTLEIMIDRALYDFARTEGLL